MLFPSIFRDPFGDDFFRAPMDMPKHRPAMQMKTDVQENDSAYTLTMELPGISKENISLTLKEGYLTVAATTEENTEDAPENGSYIRRERYTGSCSRSFYVGTELSVGDISAKFADGILTLTVPKPENLPHVEEQNVIPIE